MSSGMALLLTIVVSFAAGVVAMDIAQERRAAEQVCFAKDYDAVPR